MEDEKSKKQFIVQILWFLFGIGTIAVAVFNMRGYFVGSAQESGNNVAKLFKIVYVIVTVLMAVLSLIWWMMRKNPERKTLRIVLFTIISEFIIAGILYFAFFAVLTAALHPIEMVVPCLYLIFAVPWYVLSWVLIKLNPDKKKTQE